MSAHEVFSVTGSDIDSGIGDCDATQDSREWYSPDKISLALEGRADSYPYYEVLRLVQRHKTTDQGGYRSFQKDECYP